MTKTLEKPKAGSPSPDPTQDPMEIADQLALENEKLREELEALRAAMPQLKPIEPGKRVTFFSKSAFFKYFFEGRRSRLVPGPDGEIRALRHDNPVAHFAPEGSLQTGGYYRTSDPEEIAQLRDKCQRNPEMLMELAGDHI